MRPQRADDHSGFDPWLSRAQEGHADGFDVLVRWLEGPLLGFARARRADDPHGVVNEVLLRAFRSLGSFSGGATEFRGWVFQIARNLIIDQTRARSRRVVEYATAPSDMPPVLDDSDEIDRIDGTPRIATLLETLPVDQREVLVLRIIADLPVEETARIMDRSPGSVRVLQHRALARLRQNLSDEL